MLREGLLMIYVTATVAMSVAHSTDDMPLLVQYQSGVKQGVIMTDEMIEEEEYYDSLETLALCVEAEAGNQGLLGKQLVADVILNRVDSPYFPNDINSVISEKGQFDVWSSGAMNRIIEPSEETLEAVRLELENRTNNKILYFKTGGYHAGHAPILQHGAHYFSGRRS